MRSVNTLNALCADVDVVFVRVVHPCTVASACCSIAIVEPPPSSNERIRIGFGRSEVCR